MRYYNNVSTNTQHASCFFFLLTTPLEEGATLQDFHKVLGWLANISWEQANTAPDVTLIIHSLGH